MARGIWGRTMDWLLDIMWGDIGRPATLDERFTLGEAPTGSVPRSGGGKRDPKMSLVKRVGLAILGGDGGRDFEPPEWDFEEITNAYNTEGYIRQAVDKYIEMMFKADWKWVGKNPAAVEYVDMRFKLMAEATDIPTDQLFIEIAEDLIKYCNVVIAKARAKDNLPFQGMNVMGVGDNMPCAGYFPLNLSGMQIRRDKNGTVRGWQQELEGSDKPVRFKPEDIVHIYYRKEKGRAFGTPWLLPALDDIRALRQVEENVLRLVYRNLHPLWHIKVGLAEEGFFGEDDEVDAVRAEVENMDVEGGLITTERVNIVPIASNQIIDANQYLKHFEQRAFTVLGVSELMMGRGNTANRSTGDNLSGEFKDRVKAFQKVMSTFINEKMVKEILMEGGFDPVLNPLDAVRFEFNEIDLDSQIKKENHALFLYEHEGITESEMRELIGRDPIEDGEDRAGMYLNTVKIPTMEAQAALKLSSTSDGNQAGTKSTNNKNKPTNQHGTKTSPKKTTNFEQDLERVYKELNQYVFVLSEKHRGESEHDQASNWRKMFSYFEDKMMDTIAHYHSEEIANELHIPVRRMIESLFEHCMEYASFDEATTKELFQASFDVYYDTLAVIVNKAEELKEGGANSWEQN